MASSIPAVLAAVVAAARAALPDVQVIDGQPVTDIAGDVVCVGWGDDGSPGVESTRTVQQLTAAPDREAYDVACLASSWTGATDPVQVRARAVELVDAIAAQIAADPRLGGVVMQARVSVVGLLQEQTSQGAAATCRFTVHVDAFGR